MVSNDETFSQIIEHLTKLAKADGKITEEEEALLIEAQVSLMMYDEALSDALEDGIITDEEKELLEGLKEQAIQTSWELAKETAGISDDELKMLEILARKLRGK